MLFNQLSMWILKSGKKGIKKKKGCSQSFHFNKHHTQNNSKHTEKLEI